MVRMSHDNGMEDVMPRDRKDLSENTVCASKIIWHGGLCSRCNGDLNIVTEWAQV